VAVPEAVLPVLMTVAFLAIMRGRFRIWKRSTNYRLVLSIIASQDAVGPLNVLANKVGGNLLNRETRFGRTVVVWEIHDQDVLTGVIETILEMQQEDGLELPEQMQREVDTAWIFLNTPVYRGRLTAERRQQNKESLEERARLYELMKEYW